MTSAPGHQVKRKTQKILRFTSMCNNLAQSGNCPYGSKCKFAHSWSELRAKPDLRGTAPCSRFLSGRCRAGSRCKFAHIEPDSEDSSSTRYSTSYDDEAFDSPPQALPNSSGRFEEAFDLPFSGSRLQENQQQGPGVGLSSPGLCLSTTPSPISVSSYQNQNQNQMPFYQMTGSWESSLEADWGSQLHQEMQVEAYTDFSMNQMGSNAHQSALNTDRNLAVPTAFHGRFGGSQVQVGEEMAEPVFMIRMSL
eukprot:TRINITY_DN30687_c0_g1_i1.p1 TRINITY_DN30687_c0_g1~~TRINITY_DN30687_c0_g1_i1.p1  ORF type:complete len:251 (+),score=37.65 TRINITY_DN30687_c0_g1_i1:96-848(+)